MESAESTSGSPPSHRRSVASRDGDRRPQRPKRFDNPSQIQATRRYLTDARRLLESSESADEFYQEMLRLHPGRINPGALWGAAITLFPTISAS